MGSSSKTTNSTSNMSQTTTPNAPSWVSNSLQGYNTQVQNLAASNPQQYVTGPSANQNAAYTQAQNTLDSTNPNYATGSQDVSSNATIDPTQSSSISDFMNPYQTNVVGADQALYNQQNAQSMAQMQGQAALTGAFGGSRYGVAQGQLAASNELNENNTLAGLLSSGYTTAANEALSNAQLGQSAGTSLSQIATQQAAANDANLTTQDALGQDQRSIAQAQATAPISLAQTIGSLNSMGQYGLLTGSSTNGTAASNSTTTSDPSLLSDLGSIADLAQGGTKDAAGLTSLASLFG